MILQFGHSFGAEKLKLGVLTLKFGDLEIENVRKKVVVVGR